MTLVRILERIFRHLRKPRRSFRECFLEVVREQEGLGEVGGNNAGPHVAKFKRLSHWRPKENLGAWCADGTAWCIEEALKRARGGRGNPEAMAAEYAGVDLDEWLRRSRAAIGLARMLEAKFGASDIPEPGMLALWKRPGAGWQHHISPVVEVSGELYVVMQFNHGRRGLIRTTEHVLGHPKFGALEFRKFIRTEPPT